MGDLLVSKRKSSGYAYSNLVLISQFGIHMMVTVFLCLSIGIYIDKRYHLYLTIPMLIIGMLAGCRNTYALAKRANKRSENERVCREEREFVDGELKKWNDGRQFTTRRPPEQEQQNETSEEEN